MGGCTALHYALLAQPSPDLSLVEKLVKLNPSASKETTSENWNALHLSLKNWSMCSNVSTTLVNINARYLAEEQACHKNTRYDSLVVYRVVFSHP